MTNKTDEGATLNGEDTPENVMVRQYMDEMMGTFREMMAEIKDGFGEIKRIRDSVPKPL